MSTILHENYIEKSNRGTSTQKKLTAEGNVIFIAIDLAARLGKRIAAEYPQIAEMYRQGYTLRQLVEREFFFDVLYETTPQIAQKAVHYALVGFRGSKREEGYNGLLDQDEARLIGKRHRAEASSDLAYLLIQDRKGINGLSHDKLVELCRRNGELYGSIGGDKARDNKLGLFRLSEKEKKAARKNGGNNSYRSGVGVHGRTKEQMSRDGHNAGIKGGRKTSELQVGIHALTPEERRKNGSNGGIEGGKKLVEQKKGVHALSLEEHKQNGIDSALKRGFIPLSNAEKARIMELTEQGMTSKKIAEILNNEFHNDNNVRSDSSVRFHRKK